MVLSIKPSLTLCFSVSRKETLPSSLCEVSWSFCRISNCLRLKSYLSFSLDNRSSKIESVSIRVSSSSNSMPSRFASINSISFSASEFPSECVTISSIGIFLLFVSFFPCFVFEFPEVRHNFFKTEPSFNFDCDFIHLYFSVPRIVFFFLSNRPELVVGLVFSLVDKSNFSIWLPCFSFTVFSKQ
ncbi:hypothetical protein AWRI1631_43040 [Saccharomyces cerevisiae AWRI1631]|uniref:Uncharacterized protein n=1 Tax=Saccharomyces cerevisiae (strain AWRI1631) TaxID=545124 RepID=B5VFY2_YEAS6|nr:hypothetical protein AWRI1631_43040 [Saccharomyces cerevisiae AWRI1631]